MEFSQALKAAKDAVLLDELGTDTGATISSYLEAIRLTLNVLRSSSSSIIPRDKQLEIAQKAKQYLDRVTELQKKLEEQQKGKKGTPKYEALSQLLSTTNNSQQQQQQQQQAIYPAMNSDFPASVISQQTQNNDNDLDPICKLLPMIIISAIEKHFIVNQQQQQILLDLTPQGIQGISVTIHSPEIFSELRKFAFINDSDLMDSFTKTAVKQIRSAGRSGALFYGSGDGKFLCKSVSATELSRLQELLPALKMHFSSQSSQSLLVRFIAAFTIQQQQQQQSPSPSPSSQQPVTILIMENLIPPEASKHINVRYDLKGSTHNRTATNEELQQPDFVLKDVDLISRGIMNNPFSTKNLGKKERENILFAIDRDSRFLESQGVMDYSLLVAVRKDAPITSTPSILSKNDSFSSLKSLLQQQNTTQNSMYGFFRSDLGGMRIYDESGRQTSTILYLGIIDFLQPYNLKKILEHAVKALMVPSGQEVSVTDPSTYAERFRKFFFQLLYPSSATPSTITPTPR